MHTGRPLWLIFLSAVIAAGGLFVTLRVARAQQQRLVESVDIQGNRRHRKEDLIYYIQTREGDPYNERTVQNDLQTLLALGFFEKTTARVEVSEGARSGVNVIFHVEELPIIRDIQFEGLKSVPESDVLKAFRERRVGISKESTYDPVKAQQAKRVIKELLSEKGHPNATIDIAEEEVSATSKAITFKVNEGERVRVVEIQFEGNQVFSSGKLRSQMKYVKEAGLISRFKGQDILHREKLEYDLRAVKNYMASKGYLQARVGEPRVEGIGKRQTGFWIPLPFLSSTDEALRITVPVNEGRLYRIGELKIEGNSIFSEQIIRNVIGLKPGDIANGERIGKGLFEDLEKAYGSQGFIQYTAEPTPTFKDNPNNPKEGIVDFTIGIEEGKQFTLRRLEFLGNTFTRDNVLRREVLINEGDVYNQQAIEYSVVRLNQLGYFEPVDPKKDIERRTNDEEGLVDVNLKVSERGRQQISFNGGIAGSLGSFFGLEYSTNNLLGRGETLSFQLSAGNRQRAFQFSFTEPYIKNRPITTGFTLFTYRQKFFGEGTGLSQNLTAQEALLGSSLGGLDLLTVGEENLFTRTSTGASLFASAPLSEFYRKRRFTQFSRVGLSYQISQTSVTEPAVNQQNNAQTFIPILFNQPNILTSRITPTFVYDTRNYAKDANDPVSGKQISASLGFAGLIGDVNEYSPVISYTQFIPVRHKGRDQQPEVFGFRLLGATVGSFSISDRVRNTGALAFINGVPVYERFFLGDEYTIRGYNTRSISPIIPLDTYISSRNLSIATNASGTPSTLTGIPASLLNSFVLTGASGANPSTRISRVFQPIGGDTQLLGNFEYRIPIFGPLSAAAYADIGTSFNLRSGGDQVFSSNFVTDQPFLAGTGIIQCAQLPGGFANITLSTLAACSSTSKLALVPSSGALVLRDNRLITQEEFNNALSGSSDPATGLPFGLLPVYLRGEAATNTVARLSEARFAKFSDLRSSLGFELRMQVPVINVPFRLIYAFNPNARRGVVSGLPFLFDEKRSGFRFSVGRTF